MEPIEINAGAWYLRALRSDDRVDDTPVLRACGIDDADYIARRGSTWADGSVLSWAVCQPTTGEMLGEVVLDVAADTTTSWSAAGQDEAVAAGAAAVRRFADHLRSQLQGDITGK